MQLLPGSPFNDQAYAQARAQIEAEYGLDDPLLVQYARYMGNLAQETSGTPTSTVGSPSWTSSWSGCRSPLSWALRRWSWG